MKSLPEKQGIKLASYHGLKPTALRLLIDLRIICGNIEYSKLISKMAFLEAQKMLGSVLDTIIAQ